MGNIGKGFTGPLFLLPENTNALVGPGREKKTRFVPPGLSDPRPLLSRNTISKNTRVVRESLPPKRSPCPGEEE